VAKTDFKTIDEYIGTFPSEVQDTLNRIRQLIKQAAPEADEAISYQIPTLKLKGKYVVYFAGYKKHVSMYPVTAAMVEAYDADLSPYRSGKGTLQFPLAKPLPLELISKLVKCRVEEMSGSQRT
jgi:uncharacterized protein YdhG (YjbR/CyaY superfamily)